MTKRQLLPILSLMVLFLAACAPSATSANPPVEEATQPPAVSVSTVTVAVSEAPVEEATAPPVATSRGPDLHATDPTTVSLASGSLHFVEFFRFT